MRNRARDSVPFALNMAQTVGLALTRAIILTLALALTLTLSLALSLILILTGWAAGRHLAASRRLGALARRLGALALPSAVRGAARL